MIWLSVTVVQSFVTRLFRCAYLFRHRLTDLINKSVCAFWDKVSQCLPHKLLYICSRRSCLFVIELSLLLMHAMNLGRIEIIDISTHWFCHLFFYMLSKNLFEWCVSCFNFCSPQMTTNCGHLIKMVVWSKPRHQQDICIYVFVH